MHKSASDKILALLEGYLHDFTAQPLTILEVGSQVVEATQYDLRAELSKKNWTYVGMDIEAGPNVDVAVKQPYDWQEIASDSADVIICNQVFEHVGFTWVTMLEIARVLKEGGLAFIIAPSAGPEHRYPTDCWRIYPDGWRSLCTHAELNVLEVFTQWKPLYYTDGSDKWQDSCLVAQKPAKDGASRQAFTRRVALQKLLMQPGLAQGEVIAALDVPQAEVAASIIPPMSGRDVLAAYAKNRAVISGFYPLHYKKRAISLHLRRLLKELFTFVRA